MEDPELLEATRHNNMLDETLEPPSDQADSFECETTPEGRTVVWTDGATRRNQDRRLRRAGVGVYYGEGHVMNIAIPLPGREQTNNRAELMAIILAVERDRRQLWVRSDSEYCVAGCKGLLETGRIPRGRNADL